MLAISKPVTYTSDNWIGAVATYDVGSISSSQDINGYITSDNSTLGHNIGWETSPSNTDWSNGSTAGYGLFTIVISAIGSDTNPSIATLNSHPLITDYLHSSHSNSLNGTAYNLAGTALTWDYSSMTLSISGADTISYTSINLKKVTGTLTAADGVRTLDTAGSTWYLNGISTGAAQSGGSGNEGYPTDYFSKTDFRTDTINYKDKIIEKISTNQTDIIEYLVKSTLPPNAIKQLFVELNNEGIID